MGRYLVEWVEIVGVCAPQMKGSCPCLHFDESIELFGRQWQYCIQSPREWLLLWVLGWNPHFWQNSFKARCTNLLHLPRSVTICNHAVQETRQACSPLVLKPCWNPFGRLRHPRWCRLPRRFRRQEAAEVSETCGALVFHSRFLFFGSWWPPEPEGKVEPAMGKLMG